MSFLLLAIPPSLAPFPAFKRYSRRVLPALHGPAVQRSSGPAVQRSSGPAVQRSSLPAKRIPNTRYNAALSVIPVFT